MKNVRKRVIGYLRVSTQMQDLQKNKSDILMLANSKGLGRVEWIEEKVSGTLDWHKRKIGEVMNSLKAGDVVIVSELSRLGRSALQILEIMKIATEKKIEVYAVKGNWSLDKSMSSKILLSVFAMVSEIERDLISERTKEGLRAAKASGKMLGRPKGPGKSKLDDKQEEIVALLRNGSTQSYVSKRFGTTAPNLNLWLKKRKIKYAPVIPQM
jgi:DNA invertase Pin-like site-specific DNA recombinase